MSINHQRQSTARIRKHPGLKASHRKAQWARASRRQRQGIRKVIHRGTYAVSHLPFFFFLDYMNTQGLFDSLQYRLVGLTRSPPRIYWEPTFSRRWMNVLLCSMASCNLPRPKMLFSSMRSSAKDKRLSRCWQSWRMPLRTSKAPMNSLVASPVSWLLSQGVRMCEVQDFGCWRLKAFTRRLGNILGVWRLRYPLH